MRVMQNTLYVTTPNLYLALDGENILLQKEGAVLHRLPLHNLEGVVAFGYTGASPALMGACAERGIALTFLSMHGRFLARVVGKSRGNVLLRKKQYAVSAEENESLAIAKPIIKAKLYNSRSVLKRAVRDYALRLNTEKFKNAIDIITNQIEAVDMVANLEILRGLEGVSAAAYFSTMDDLILQQKEAFSFSARNRWPPMDPVNALLSFVYTLLAHDTAAAVEAVGLDAYVGFLHRDRPGRISLALDVMEEFRPVIADRFVLKLINTKQVQPDGFLKKESGAVIMTDEVRKVVLAAWQKRKQKETVHPFLKEKVEWGLIPYVQALLLARSLRGDLDAYPPFLWK